MKIQVQKFSGIMPKIANDKLPEGMAQTVRDAKTSSQELVAYKAPTGDVELSGSSYKSLFEYLEGVNTHWVYFDRIVHWARSPVADDSFERLYMTGGPATKAQGTITFLDNVADGDTVTVGADTYEFDIADDGVGGGNIDTGSAATTTAELAAAAIVAAELASGTAAVAMTDNGDGTVTVEADTAGAAGNTIAFSCSSPTTKISCNTYGDTLFLGGTQEGQDANVYRAFSNDLVSTPFDMDNDVYYPGADAGAAPTIVPSAGAGDYVAYFYTYTSRYGEEGPASAIGEHVNADDDTRNEVNSITYPTDDHLITDGTNQCYVSLYRTVATAQTGEALFLHVLDAYWFDATITYATGDYVFYDDGGGWDLYEVTVGGVGEFVGGSHTFVAGEAITAAELTGGTCDTWYYDRAVDGMTNLRAHPNGFFVASKGNMLYFSEPFAPWGWPEDYQIPLDAQIVALGIFGSTIVVATDAWIYTFAGPHPTSLYKTKLSFQPCLNQRALIETDTGVMFPSKEGFQLVDASGVNNVTQDLFDPEDWDNFELDEIHGTYYNKSYYGFYTSASYTGGIRIDFINGAITTFNKYHHTGYVSLQDGVFRTIVNSEIDDPTLYIARWDTNDGAYTNYEYKSPRLIAEKPVNFKVAQVILDSDFYNDVLSTLSDESVLEDLNQDEWDKLAAGNNWGAGDLEGPFNSMTILGGTDHNGLELNGIHEINGDTLYSLGTVGVQNYVEFRLYADSVLKFTKQITTSTMFKLPRGFRDKKWHFELSGMIPVKRVSIATSTEEIV
jgi:hypothetical protein